MGAGSTKAKSITFGGVMQAQKLCVDEGWEIGLHIAGRQSDREIQMVVWVRKQLIRQDTSYG